jgi:vacuolar iron transporter family protein
MPNTNTTQPGRAVRLSGDGRKRSPLLRHENRSNHSLRDVILGGQDGLVNMLGIALGLVAAGGSSHVLVVTGLAAAMTESISMGAVAYTSFGSDRDFYLAERDREKEEIAAQPHEEREEIREIYAGRIQGEASR